jgi:putative salt-induced outer membrane protein YdiY
MVRTTTIAVCVVVLVPAGVVAAPRNDVVALVNGDRMTCEIKELTRGRLSVKTDALDTVSVYWGQVDGLSTPRVFEIHTSRGDRLFGVLDHVGPRRIRVTPTGAPSVELSLDDVVRLVPFDVTFWQRIDGHVDLGFSFAKADLETSWTLNADAEYRGHRWVLGANVASQLTWRSNADRLSRNALWLLGSRAIGRKWFVLGLGQLQENEELSLELRSVVGGGAGRHIVRSNRTTLQIYGGLVHTREEYVDVPTQNLPEVAAGANWDWFTSRNNDLNLSTDVISYYAVQGEARARVELQSAFRVKFLSNFYFSVNGYDSYDSRPPDGRAQTDLGISLSLGWKFGSLGSF